MLRLKHNVSGDIKWIKSICLDKTSCGEQHEAPINTQKTDLCPNEVLFWSRGIEKEFSDMNSKLLKNNYEKCWMSWGQQIRKKSELAKRKDFSLHLNDVRSTKVLLWKLGKNLLHILLPWIFTYFQCHKSTSILERGCII